MKERFLFLSLLMLCASLRLQGQEVVTLTVKDLNDKAQIKLLYKGKELNQEDKLPLEGKDWTFAVEPNNLVFEVGIEQNALPRERVRLKSEEKKYEVKGGVLAEGNLKMAGSVRIKIIKQDGGTAKSYTNIDFIPEGKPEDSGNGGGNAAGNGANDSGNPNTPAEEHPIGSVYYDALYLSNPENDREITREILAYYAELEANAKYEAIAPKLAGNKFLVAALPRLTTGKAAVNGAGIASAQGGKSVGPFSLSSIGGLDVTNVADGLAKFLVKRTKQELNVAFFQRFKKLIADSNYVDLQTVFPQTYDLLSVIGEDVYDYQRYIQNLRESFKNDLDELNRNLPTIIPNHRQFFDARPALKATLQTGFYVSTALEDQVHPGDILADYPVAYLDAAVAKKAELQNLQGAIQTLQLVSASLRDTAASAGQEDLRYWVSIKQIRELVNNKKAFGIYLGLLYQEALNKYNSIPYNQKDNLVVLLNKVADDFTNDKDGAYTSYKRYILQFGERADALNKMIREYDRPATDSLAFEQYARYFRTSVDLLSYSLEATRLPYVKTVTLNNGKPIGSLADSLRRYFTIAYSASDLVIEVNRRNYSAALNHAVRIYDLVRVKPIREEREEDAANRKKFDNLPAPTRDLLTKYYDQWRTFTKGDTTKPLPSAEQDKLDSMMPLDRWNRFKPLVVSVRSANLTADSVEKSQQAIRTFIKYGGFMASVATAKNSDEVERAIEAFALPAGSARVKRESSFNVSLNAYTGLFVGQERIRGAEKESKPGINSFGVTAPVGIAVSTGKKRFLCIGEPGTGHWSYSLFISLIDVGTVAAFRFTDPGEKEENGKVTKTETAEVPTIQLQDIISPGLFFSIGIPKSPISFNIGTQVGPNLRKINVTTGTADGDQVPEPTLTNEYTNSTYLRHSISLVVDIPILNFHTKARR